MAESTLHTAMEAGTRLALRRPWLVVLLWAAGFLPALFAMLPVQVLLDTAVSGTGFSRHLARTFDVVLLADLVPHLERLPEQVTLQPLWLLPLTLLWNAVSRAGLTWALREGGWRPFWEGVVRHGLRSIGISLALLPLLLPIAIVLLVAGILTAQAMPGERGNFWAMLFVLPLLSVILFSYLVLVRSYALYTSVIERKRIFGALVRGMAWPFRYSECVLLHLAWLGVAVLLSLVPVAAEYTFTGATPASLIVLVVIQQAAFLLRSFALVAWTGSEVFLFERVLLREQPLIAAAE